MFQFSSENVRFVVRTKAGCYAYSLALVEGTKQQLLSLPESWNHLGMKAGLTLRMAQRRGSTNGALHTACGSRKRQSQMKNFPLSMPMMSRSLATGQAAE